MLFSRTYSYSSAMPAHEIKRKLMGKHVNIHKMDFQVLEEDLSLKIIPNAEQEIAIKTLPVTEVQLEGKGDRTKVVIISKMREIDAGGPILIVVFSAFMLLASLLFFLFGSAEYVSFTYTLLGIGATTLGVFWTRMDLGYFDYIRKIKEHVKENSLSVS